jgi:hypothetical protein
MNERSIHVAATVRCAKPRHEHIDVDDDDVTGRFVRVTPAEPVPTVPTSPGLSRVAKAVVAVISGIASGWFTWWLCGVMS